MTGKSSLPYTSAQRKAIDDAHYALMRAVERSNLMERRINAVLKSEAKEFGLVSAKAHVAEFVYHGMREAGPATLANLCYERDEKIICYMVGVYLLNALDNGPQELIRALESSKAAWNEAHRAYLESV